MRPEMLVAYYHPGRAYRPGHVLVKRFSNGMVRFTWCDRNGAAAMTGWFREF